MQTYLVKFLSILTLFSCGTEYKSSEPEKSVNLNIQPVTDPNDSERSPNFQPNRPGQPNLGLRPEQPVGQRPVEPIRDPYLKTYRCMYQRAEQVNRCVQFSFVEMSKEAEVGLLCQNLSFPGSFFVKMEASPCPDLGWFFSSRRRFQAYQADIWMIDTAERPGQRPPVFERPSWKQPRPAYPGHRKGFHSRNSKYRPRR